MACEQCDSSCESCSGPSDDQCTVCYDGYWRNSSSHCVNCHSSCQTCNGSSQTDCLTCPVGIELQNSNMCFDCEPNCKTCSESNRSQCQTCYDGYGLTEIDQCVECHPSCKTCNGSSENNCLSCHCITELINSNQCQDCNPTCETCSGPDANECLTCYDDYGLNQASQCVACDQSCKTCDGSSQTNCLTCHGSTVLRDSNQCYDCDPTCETCSGPEANECLTCRESDGLTQDNQCVACDQSCKTCDGSSQTNCLTCHGSTVLRDSNQCYDCDPTCETCSGPDANECLTCRESDGLTQNNQCVTCDQSCKTCDGSSQTNCLTCHGSTVLRDSNQCYDCDPACETCSGPEANECLTCRETDQLTQEAECIKCHSTCKTCDGSSQTNCLTCHGSTVLRDSNQCYDCDPTCETCSGPEANECLTCRESDGLTQDNQCVPCQLTCKTCFGPLHTDCSSCDLPSYLDPATHSCTQDTSNIPLSALQEPTSKSLGQAASTGMKAQSALTSALPIIMGGFSTAAIVLLEFFSDVDIYKFINVPFPPNFKAFFAQMSDSFFIPNPFEPMSGRDTAAAEPMVSSVGKFGEWEVNTVFLDNSGSNIVKELIALVVILLATMFASAFAKSSPCLSSKMSKVANLFKWNTFLSFYIGDFSEFFINSLIQFREGKLNTAYEVVSFCFCIVIVVSYMIMLGVFAYLLNRKRRIVIKPTAHRDGRGSRRYKKRVPRNISLLIEDFNTQARFSRNLMLLILLQNLLIVMVVFFLQDYGLVQACLYTVATLCFLILVFVYRPFKSKVQMGIFSLNEIVKTVMGVLAITLGTLSSRIEEKNGSAGKKIGVVLIALVLTTIAINTLIAVILAVAQIWKACTKKDAQTTSRSKFLQGHHTQPTATRRVPRQPERGIDLGQSGNSKKVSTRKNRTTHGHCDLTLQSNV